MAEDPFAGVTTWQQQKPPAAAASASPLAPAPIASSHKDPFAGVNWKRTGTKIDQGVKGMLDYGHKHPFEAVMSILGAPQRGLQALETGQDIGHAIMSPGDEKKLEAAVKNKIGLTGLESGALAGNDLFHKFARGVLDTGLDIVNDPVTFIPGMDVTKAVRVGAEKIAPKAVHALGSIFDGETALSGLTDLGKGKYEQVVNLAKESGRSLKHSEDMIVNVNAQAIRAGKLPQDVIDLFRDPKSVPTIAKGTNPRDIIKALDEDRRPHITGLQTKGLQQAGLINNPATAHLSSNPAMNVKLRTDYFKDPTTIEDTKNMIAAIKPHVPNDNVILSALRTATRLGNQAFLVSPFPHMMNLMNLAYNKYGLPTVAKGMIYAAQVSTGKVSPELAAKLAELESLGAKSEYANIFNELGLTKVAGLPGTEGLANLANKAIIPAEKFTNHLQNKFLNPLESGLRVAAMEAEKAGGKQGVLATRNIHRTFGTDAPSKFVQSVSELGQAFAPFHLTTTPRSGLEALANHPGRFSNALKAQRDMNAQINPGNSAEYRPSTPTFGTARALSDPARYFSSALGPLFVLGGDFSVLSEIEKGKVMKAIQQVAAHYTPGSEEYDAIVNMIKHQKGPAGEAPLGDLISSAITGGYYTKPKR